MLPANVRLDWKVIARYKTLANLASSSATKEKSFIPLTPDHDRGEPRMSDKRKSVGTFRAAKLFAIQNVSVLELQSIGLYHPLDGATNLKYKLLCFLTPNKIIFQEKGATF